MVGVCVVGGVCVAVGGGGGGGDGRGELGRRIRNAFAQIDGHGREAGLVKVDFLVIGDLADVGDVGEVGGHVGGEGTAEEGDGFECWGGGSHCLFCFSSFNCGILFVEEKGMV